MPESWPTFRGDGDRKNSDPASLVGNLRLKWSRGLIGLQPYVVSKTDPKYGIRSNNLSIRDGKIGCIIPGTDFENSLGVHTKTGRAYRASFGIFSIKTGQLLTRCMTAHQNGGNLFSASGGIMDSDTNIGQIVQYWRDDNVVYFAHGSDHSCVSRIDAYTGEIVPNTSLGLAPGPNASAYFGMIEGNVENWARGGNNNHSPFFNAQMKHYAGFLLKDNLLYRFICKNKVASDEFSADGFGISLAVDKLVTPSSSYTSQKRTRVWEYSSDTDCFSGFGLHHCNGAPRAVCLGEDGTVYYFGFVAQNIPLPGKTLAWSPDYTKGMRLFGVKQSDIGGVKTLEIETGYNPQAVSGMSSSTVYKYYSASIATIGKYVVAYQPQQSYVPQAALFIFDTQSKKLIHSKIWPKNSLPTTTSVVARSWNREQASQMLIAGDSCFVFDTYHASGVLKVSVLKKNLDTGVETTKEFVPTDDSGQPYIVDTTVALNFPVLRSLAAHNGTIVAQIDFNRINQLLVGIDGDQNSDAEYSPIAVIKEPWLTGINSFTSSPSRPINQFDSEQQIKFSSEGSVSVDGTACTFLWDFGNGQTSTEPNPVYAYPSNNKIGEVSTHIVTLKVTAANGKSSIATKNIIIRDTGTWTRTSLVPIDIGYPDPTRYRTSNKPYRIYYKFDVSGKDKIREAKFRIRGYYIDKTGEVPSNASIWDVPRVDNPRAITIDAKDYIANIPNNGVSWTEVSDGIQALPNKGLTTLDVSASPRVDYAYNFPEGTTYVWVFGIGPSLVDDSCHIGVDGVLKAASVTGFSTRGTWVKTAVTVPSGGGKTLNVWMREDGLIIRYMIVTQDDTFVPGGPSPDGSWNGSTITKDNMPNTGALISELSLVNNSSSWVDYEFDLTEYIKIHTGEFSIVVNDAIDFENRSVYGPRVYFKDSGILILNQGDEIMPTPEPDPIPEPVPDEYFSDDGDVNFTTSGSWATGSVPGGYQGDYRYAPAGIGSDKASWSFAGLTPGSYEIFASWVSHANRASNAPYTIFNGLVTDSSLGTVAVNQRVAPADNMADGIKWKSLGIFAITGTTLSVELTNQANGFVIADGVRIRRIATPNPNPTPDPEPAQASIKILAASPTSTESKDGATWTATPPLLNLVPNVGKGWMDRTLAPSATYRINFPKAGIYYVWVKGSGASGSDDSCYISLGTTSNTMALNKGALKWSKALFPASTNRPMIVVPSIGEHDVVLQGREDGATVSEIFLTTDQSAIPV